MYSTQVFRANKVMSVVPPEIQKSLCSSALCQYAKKHAVFSEYCLPYDGGMPVKSTEKGRPFVRSTAQRLLSTLSARRFTPTIFSLRIGRARTPPRQSLCCIRFANTIPQASGESQGGCWEGCLDEQKERPEATGPLKREHRAQACAGCLFFGFLSDTISPAFFRASLVTTGPTSS